MVIRELGCLIQTVLSSGVIKNVHCETRRVELMRSPELKDEVAEKVPEERIKRCDKLPECVDEWGINVEWVSLEKGIRLAKSLYKPLLVIIAREDCPKCEILRSQLTNEFTEVSKDFVMVLVEQQDIDPVDVAFFPDGEYTPRALFFHPDGPFLARYTNASPFNKYFYRSSQNLIKVMKKAKFYFLDPM